MIKFSIVVPVYNTAIYIEDCINSILRQTYQNFELILVDDGSTDNCPKICDKYKDLDNRIIVIHKKNGGLVSARKAGIKMATGEYAVCVDSDDWISEDYLFTVNDVIKKYGPDIVCFDYYEVTPTGKKERSNSYRKGYFSKKDIIEEVFPSLIQDRTGKSFPPAIWAKVYRMDLYKTEQLAVNEGIIIGEDAACTVPCIAKAYSIYNLDKSIYYYRINNSSLTKDKQPFRWNGPELIYMHHKSRLCNIDYSFDGQIYRRTVHALLNVVKTHFYRKENYFSLVKEIKMHLDSPTYKNVLERCKYKDNTAIAFFGFCLKHRMLFPVFLLSKIR